MQIRPEQSHIQEQGLGHARAGLARPFNGFGSDRIAFPQEIEEILAQDIAQLFRPFQEDRCRFMLAKGIIPLFLDGQQGLDDGIL